MGGKRSAKDIDKALAIRKRKDIKKNGKNNKNINENAKPVTAVASLPSRVVFSMPQPPTSPRGNDAASPAAAKNDGGMAFLGLKVIWLGVAENRGGVCSTKFLKCGFRCRCFF